MSDGNFNRALLPPTPYGSGVRMGQQQTKSKAIKALHSALDNIVPPLSQKLRDAITANFEMFLNT